MTTRFHLDLLHPGWVAETWQEWFVGPKGARRLAMLTVGCVVVLLIVLAAMLPTYWKLSQNLSAVPGLQRDLAARETDLSLLRSNLGALAEEARRQIRWAEVLGTLGQQIPPTLKLQLVEAARGGPPAGGQQAGTPGGSGGLLRIDAVTPLRPGSPPLLEVAQFMAGLMRDPAVNKRFELKSWEIKPGAGAAGVPLLSVGIVLSERAQ